MDMEKSVTTAATTSVKVHTNMIGKAANAYVLVNALRTTP